ncbi:MAG: DNA polymerase I [bacterium]
MPFTYTNGAKEKNAEIFEVKEEVVILDKEKTLEKLKSIFKNSNIKKILHHAKFDLLALSTESIEVDGVVFDTLLAANLLRWEEEWQKISLKSLSVRYLNERMTTYKELLGKKYKTFDAVPLKEAAEYAAHDALQTFKLESILSKDLDKDKKLKDIFEKIELPLMFVLFDMEKTGIKVDVEVLKELSKKVERKLKTIHEKITEAIKYGSKDYKEDFNVNSPQQVEKLLFDDLKLPVIKKSSKGHRSTDQEVLEKLSEHHPIPVLILHYRELFKLLNTYIDPLQKMINPKTGRVHTSFSQTMVATGRLSSSEPNLQNIPATKGYGMQIRSAFVAPRGREFLSADYSQMELRVLAHITKDKNLKKAFIDDIDIHAQTAAQLFNVALENVTNEQRQIGKRINFSIIYGLTPFGLAKDLNIKPGEAKEYIEKYFEQYPGVLKWIEKTEKEAQKNGYVETLMGRRRYIPELKEKNRLLYEAGKRMAINSPIQGTSAEIIKIAMIDLYRAFETKKIDAKILLQIHDELLIEYDSKKEEIVKKIVKNCLEDVIKWDVPLKISMRTGKNWEKVSK